MLTEKNEGVADLAGFLDGIGDFFHQCGFLFWREARRGINEYNRHILGYDCWLDDFICQSRLSAELVLWGVWFAIFLTATFRLLQSNGRTLSQRAAPLTALNQLAAWENFVRQHRRIFLRRRWHIWERPLHLAICQFQESSDAGTCERPPAIRG